MLIAEFIMTQPEEVRENAILEDGRIHIPTTVKLGDLMESVDFSKMEELPSDVKSLYMFLTRTPRPEREVSDILMSEAL